MREEEEIRGSGQCYLHRVEELRVRGHPKSHDTWTDNQNLTPYIEVVYPTPASLTETLNPKP